MYIERRNIRYIEIGAGIFLILSVLSVLAAFLLNFDYTIPNATFEEDVDFMKESVSSQKISATAWFVAGLSNLFFLPIYLILFNRFQKGMHIASGFFILGMAYSFFTIGVFELNVANASYQYLNDPDIFSNIPTMYILPKIRQIMILHKIGVTAFGAFASLFIFSRFSKLKFPVFGSILTFLAGPVIIAFTWLNPDHILLTSSLALAWTGLLIISARLINKGLEVKS